ncbi:Alpha/beta hydrolase [gamma proteobacterium IMCC2047]|nr:Alpha/beta hydrolase [gamma proteobacterium IMCC2047]
MSIDNAARAASKFIESTRLRLHYRDWGNIEAPPLLLVHGGFDHCRSWDWAASQLCNDYRVITPDLRGHGDSEWSGGNAYSMADYVCDMAELIDQLALSPVSIIGHSLGGAITLKYAGAFPEKVKQLVIIEGLVPPQKMQEENEAPPAQKLARWVKQMQRFVKRPHRRYASQEEAIKRMHEANSHLTETYARHLAIHGSRQNEDGSYSWKFDPLLRAHQPFDMNGRDSQQLWQNIDCPVLLMRGEDSWASDPAKDGRAAYFQQAEVMNFADAGHWLHHDQFDLFMAAVTGVLKTQ